MDAPKTFSTPCAAMEVLDNGILLAVFNPVLTDAEGVYEHNKIFHEFFEGKKIPFLSDVRAVKKVTKEVRNLLASENAAMTCKATAIYVESSLSRIMGNVFLVASKPLFPTKLFTDKEKAMDWLMQFIDQ